MTTVTSLMAISFDAPAGPSLALVPVAGLAWSEGNQSTDCAAVGGPGDPGTAGPSHGRPAPRSVLGLGTTLLLVLAVIVVPLGDARSSRLLPHQQTRPPFRSW